MSQPQVEYVRWIKKAYPPVYRAALAKVARQNSFGGLGDDLTSNVSFDPGSVSVSDSAMSSIDNAVTSSSGNSWSDIINSIASAVGTVAPQIVQTKADLATIQLNQQRAQQGRYPVTSAGLMSGAGLSGNTGLILGAGALILGAMLLSGRKHG